MLKLSKYLKNIKIREYSTRLGSETDSNLKTKSEEPEKHHVDFYMKIFGKIFKEIL
jgi:hypothetical protein